jgi:hypothetical protein
MTDEDGVLNEINITEHQRNNQKGQSRETCNTGHTGRRKTNSNNANKIYTLLQTTGGKGRTKHSCYTDFVMDITRRNSERNDT